MGSHDRVQEAGKTRLKVFAAERGPPAVAVLPLADDSGLAQYPEVMGEGGGRDVHGKGAAGAAVADRFRA